MKKIILIAAMLMLFVGMLSFEASAESSGECGTEGSDITWSVDDLGTLRFNGSGNIKDYSVSGSNIAPWLKDNASKVKTVSFSEGITGVGEYCFYGCENLTRIVFPSSIKNIGEGALYGCGALTEISIGEGNAKYKTENGCLIDIEKNSVIRGMKDGIIPESVTEIGVGAFSGCSFESFEVPKSVIRIGQGAFDGCVALKSITLPFVGDCRLDGEGDPTVIDGETQRGQYLDRFGYIFGRAAIIPESLETVIITDTQAIGNGAFAEYSKIKNIVLPDGLVKIGEKAFSLCSGITEINFPDSLETIGVEAFKGCSGLLNIVVPDKVTHISEAAFLECNNLKSVKLGIAVNAIGSRAFAGCSSLESLAVSKENTTFYSESDCIIARSSLTLVLGCKNSVIPQNIRIIGDGAFRNCTGLTSVAIPSNVMKIGDYAFYKCIGLKTVEIPSSVEELGEFAFAECVSLSKINLTSNVKVGESAFANCVSLKSDSLYIATNDTANGNMSCVGLWIGLAVIIPLAAFGGLFAILLNKKKKSENHE